MARECNARIYVSSFIRILIASKLVQYAFLCIHILCSGKPFHIQHTYNECLQSFTKKVNIYNALGDIFFSFQSWIEYKICAYYQEFPV